MREDILDVAYEDVKLERRGFAAWITIDRAGRGNSFRRQTLDEITDALERIGDAPDVRAVVITSAGNRFFSTGGDVGDYWTRYRDDMVGMRAYERAMEKTFSEMIHCPKPIIHRINGDCVGGANAFHLAADIAVMSTNAKLQQVGTMIGSVGGFGPTQWWPQVVGDKRAREILLCCKPVSAELALQWGVVNAIAPYDKLDDAVQAYVDKLAKGFPDAMRYTKVSVNAPKELAFREMSQAREWLALHFPSMESREGFGAFFEKRAVNSEPSWKAVDTGHVTVAPYGGFSISCTSCGATYLPEDHKFCGMCGGGLPALGKSA